MPILLQEKRITSGMPRSLALLAELSPLVIAGYVVLVSPAEYQLPESAIINTPMSQQ